MMKSTPKKIYEECLYCTKKIGRDIVSPNILLYTLAYSEDVISFLRIHNTNLQLFWHIVKPVYKKSFLPKRITLSSEVKDIIGTIEEGESNLTIFKRLIKKTYIHEILALCDFSFVTKKTSAYTKLLENGNAMREEGSLYKKIDIHKGKRNVMIVAPKGSGCELLIKNYANFHRNDFSIYTFNLFRYLRNDDMTLVSIITYSFQSIPKDDLVYIPNFLTTIAWMESLKLTKALLLLEELSAKGNILSKANSTYFSSKQFFQSKVFQFHCITLPPIQPLALKEIVQLKATSFELFYSITIPFEKLENLNKIHFRHDKYLAEPARSLKKIMALALATYAENESLFDFHESFLQGSIKKLEQKLQKQIIGQDNALKILLENIHVHEMLFSGPGGTGKQKTAQILAHELFGAASFRYVDLLQLQKYPLKMRWQEHVIKEIASLQIGVIFLDNFKDDDLDQKIIINFVKEFCRINEMTIKIIYAAHQILDKDDFSGLHIQFEKLTTKDLEMIILLQIEKIKTIRDIGQIDTFALSIRAHNELSIYTIKKVLEGYLS